MRRRGVEGKAARGTRRSTSAIEPQLTFAPATVLLPATAIAFRPCCSRLYDPQMKQLELQQQLEEQQLLAASGDAKSPSAAGTAGPIRSRSGNDLASFNTSEMNEHGGAGAPHASAAAKYAAAKSMPGSRRHSGEIKEQQQKKLANGVAAAAAAGQQKDADGKPMLNSFLFDDELDADLQSGSFPARSARVSRAHAPRELCFRSAGKGLTYLVLRRLGLGRQVPPDEYRRRQVPDPRPSR